MAKKQKTKRARRSPRSSYSSSSRPSKRVEKKVVLPPDGAARVVLPPSHAAVVATDHELGHVIVVPVKKDVAQKKSWWESLLDQWNL